MAIIANTSTRYDLRGDREDLSNVVYNISPEDTPFMANGGRGKAQNTFFEWQVDSLAAAVSSNQQIEGNDHTTVAAITATVRVGTHCQISDKDFAVSGTQERVSKAGRSSELSHQVIKKMKEMKRDMEKMLMENIADSAGSISAARITAGLGAWIKSGDVLGTGGGSPSYTSVPNDDRTDATAGDTRDITEALFKTTANLVWANGGTLKLVFVGPVNKQNISKFSGIATRFTNTGTAGPTTIEGAADFYITDFGRVTVVADRFQRERDCWFIDPEYATLAYLRPFETQPLAKTGDAEKRLLLCEYAHKILNEAAHGLLADLKTTVL